MKLAQFIFIFLCLNSCINISTDDLASYQGVWILDHLDNKGGRPDFIFIKDDSLHFLKTAIQGRISYKITKISDSILYAEDYEESSVRLKLKNGTIHLYPRVQKDTIASYHFLTDKFKTTLKQQNELLTKFSVWYATDSISKNKIQLMIDDGKAALFIVNTKSQEYLLNFFPTFIQYSDQNFFYGTAQSSSTTLELNLFHVNKISQNKYLVMDQDSLNAFPSYKEFTSGFREFDSKIFIKIDSLDNIRLYWNASKQWIKLERDSSIHPLLESKSMQQAKTDSSSIFYRKYLESNLFTAVYSECTAPPPYQYDHGLPRCNNHQNIFFISPRMDMILMKKDDLDRKNIIWEMSPIKFDQQEMNIEFLSPDNL